MANLTDKKFNKVNNFLNTYIDPQAAKLFKAAHKEGKDVEWLKNNWELLEEYEPWTRTYNSIEDLTVSPEKQKERIYNANPDFSKISKARLKTILEEGDFTEDELKNYYDFRKAQTKAVDKFNQERYNEIAKTRKESERSKDKSYYTSPFANEYARKAYIQGDKDLAGKQEFLGKTAAVSDFMPFPVSLMGPAIRVSQKYNAGEDIMTPGTALDFAGAVIPDAVEKPAKIAWQFLKGSKIGKLLESKTGKQIENRIKSADNKAAQEVANEIELTEGLDVDRLTDEQIQDIYKKIKTPEIKKSIEDYWKAKRSVDEARQLGEMPNAIAKAIAERNLPEAEQALISAERKVDYVSNLNKPILEVRSGNLPKDQPLMVNGDFNTYYKDVPLKDIIDYTESQVVPNFKDEALYQLLRLGGRKAARATIGGHKWNEIDYKPNYNEDKAINEVINMYRNDWLRNGKPANYNEPLIKAAYNKWIAEQLRKGSYNDLQRMGVVK